MPTYEYQCIECGTKEEVVQSFTDPPLEECSVCGGKMRKLFFAVGIQLKGGGFYSSDRRAAHPSARKDSTKNDKKDGSSDGSSSDGSSSDSSSSDSKSDSKSESKPDSNSKSDSKQAASAGKSESSKAEKSA